MKQAAILYGVIGLLAGVLITVIVTGNVINSNNPGVMRMMGLRQGLDKHFIEQIIPHHKTPI